MCSKQNLYGRNVQRELEFKNEKIVKRTRAHSFFNIFFFCVIIENISALRRMLALNVYNVYHHIT